MPANSLEVKISDDAAVALLQREFPGYVNAAMNRAYANVGSKFSRSFASEKLGARGVYAVKRRGQVTSPGRGQPRVAKKFRLAGFKAELTGMQRLEKKSLSLRTRNPLLLIRETGGVIRPKRKKYLAVSVPKAKRGRNAKQRELRLVREVVVPAVLGFVSDWRRFAPKTREILDKGLADAVRRANSASLRRARRAA